MAAVVFSFARYGGYECSSRGDRRFSALFARMPDGRTIEMHYQCDVKGYQPGGTNWRLGKGKPPLDPSVDLYAAYKALWLEWAENHKPEMRELYEAAKKTGGVLSDMFASGPISQARALADILNDWYAQEKQMPRVLNKRTHGIPKGAVYVGRPTKWGNPFSHQAGTLAKYKVATRDEAVDAYERYLRENPELMEAAKRELRGKDLVCWCAPLRCHADVLMKYANQED